MNTLRLVLLIAAACVGVGVNTVLARQVPDASPFTSDTRGSSGFEYSRESLPSLNGGIQRDGEPVDPVVLEPIRPVLPGDEVTDGIDFHPSVCGRMNTGVPGLMLAGLVIFGMRSASTERQA
jgi:hypothetical protein